jgi:hypothetical protein
MTFLQIMAVLNAAACISLTVLVTGTMMAFRDQFIWVERLGIGLMGGSSFLTIAPLVDLSRDGTPFDAWPSFLLKIGCIMLFSGRLYRLLRHEQANILQKRFAAEHLAARGKAPIKEVE